MKIKKHIPSMPRQMFWSDELKDSNICPNCQSSLENEKHTYMVGFRDNGTIQSFIVENEGGNFCSKCPTVVLETEVFSEIIVDGDIGNSLRDINVAGIVDTLAMPEAQDFTLREANDSVPLVEFLGRSEK